MDACKGARCACDGACDFHSLAWLYVFEVHMSVGSCHEHLCRHALSVYVASVYLVFVHVLVVIVFKIGQVNLQDSGHPNDNSRRRARRNVLREIWLSGNLV